MNGERDKVISVGIGFTELFNRFPIIYLYFLRTFSLPYASCLYCFRW